MSCHASKGCTCSSTKVLALKIQVVLLWFDEKCVTQKKHTKKLCKREIEFKKYIKGTVELFMVQQIFSSHFGDFMCLA